LKAKMIAQNLARAPSSIKRNDRRPTRFNRHVVKLTQQKKYVKITVMSVKVTFEIDRDDDDIFARIAMKLKPFHCDHTRATARIQSYQYAEDDVSPARSDCSNRVASM